MSFYIIKGVGMDIFLLALHGKTAHGGGPGGYSFRSPKQMKIHKNKRKYMSSQITHLHQVTCTCLNQSEIQNTALSQVSN